MTFTASEPKPAAPAPLRERFPMERYRALPTFLAAGRCDVAFYQMGNDAGLF